MPRRASLQFALTSLASSLAASLLAGCAGGPKLPPDDEPTLASLAGRKVEVAADAGVQATEEQAIAAYRKFLEVAPRAPQRAEAMRRLGDLEMDLADRRLAEGDAPLVADATYRAAIARYEDYLRAHPKDPGRDRVFYQLARAREQGGELERALATLDRLVREHPDTAYRDEAEFRRGELLFTAQDYPRAEQAYTTVLAGADDGAYRERAQYMQGWSRFKQGRLEEALEAFFGVLDGKVAGREDESDLNTLSGLSRADRELVEDTFRVTSLSLANLQGAESIPPYLTTPERRSYEFRVYQQLGEFYLKQERVKDAADTFGQFARRQPLHAQAPVLQARVIEIYEDTGFAGQALDAKKDYVSRYGAASEFRRANPAGWARAEPLVKIHLAALARHHHAEAQRSKASADYQEAVRWYREYLTSFPDDADAPKNRFLLAELLFEDRRYAEAALEYEKTAYDEPPHAQRADAGYAALLAYAEQGKQAAAAERATLQRAGVESALRFAGAFESDPRTGPVLADAADRLYALGEGERAAGVAQQLLDLQPPAATAQRRVAWTVLAHTAFEAGRFDEAERGYGEVLALLPPQDAARGELGERLAAAIYKQGERARAAGNAREAVGHFERVAVAAPQSAVRATAQYDAAASLIELKDWARASAALEDFRQRHPNHPLQSEVGPKLAAAYLEQERWAPAAAELERLAAAPAAGRPEGFARDALWQSAGLYEKAGSSAQAAKAYERYLQQYPQPLEPAVEARHRLAQLAKAGRNPAAELAWARQIVDADQRGGAARTTRTRYLGATAALALAEPVAAEYRKVALVEPLQRQLKLKKERMEEALKAYALAADYGVADVSTAATFHTASLYQDFGRALLKSERPRKLSKAEREQYDVLLEEQAYPFEEKAMDLHEVNARRAADGLYDEWVRRSFAALAELRPVRYGKVERVEGVGDAIR